MTYDIKRTNGSVEWLVKTVHPTGTQGAKAMGENVVDMSFTLPVYVDFKINDFVVVYGETYKINLTPSVKKVGKRKFEYQIQFEHLFYDLAKVQLQFLNPQNQLLEPVFNLMGNAATIVGLIVDNANRHSPGWSVGVVDDTAYQNFSFNAENCLQVLNRLASDFETEFWIENKTIHLQKREQSSGLQFEYGQGKGLYSIYRSNKSNINILTRLYVRGGSRNLPADYRNYSTSLLLPNGATYIQDNAKVDPQTGYGLIESTIVFENIFPQREGTISAVVAGNDNWDKFTDNSLDFDVNAYKLATPAKVAFNTGQLAGYEFEISDYNHATKQFTIIQNTDEALTVPSNLIRPAVGDKYVLLDIKMPQSYVDAAEAKLLAAAQAYYAKNSDPSLNFAYSVDCDPIWFKQQNVTVVLGNTVVIYDVDLGINGAIRIAGYKRDLQIPSKYELEISDSIGASEIVRQYAQQQRTLQLIESYGLLDINQIRKNIFLNRLSESGGYLMLSGVKVSAGFADVALNANHADVADYALDADKWDGRQFSDYLNQPLRTTDDVRFKSITSTAFVSGAFGSGFKIDQNGDAVFDNLTVRKQFNVYELVLNKISGTNGALAVTDTVKIDGVTETPTGYDCTIDTAENTIAVPFQVNDLLRCQVWNGTSVKYYFAKVTAIGNGTFTLDKASKVGAGVPASGDTVVRFGNVSNPNRQGLLYLTASDGNAPYLDVLDGINSDNLAGKTKVRLGRLDGITDADLGQLDGYGIYAERAFIKGKIVVTGGNAATINNVADAKLEAINSATTQASADATVKASAAQVTAIQTAANDAASKISALKIGGRNFYNYLTQITFDNGAILVTRELNNLVVQGVNNNDGKARLHDVLKGNGWHTVSFDARVGAVNWPNNRIQFADNPTFDFSLTMAFQHFEFSFNVQNYTSDVFNFIQFEGLSGQGYIFTNFKVEAGNKATTYTPAPEDVAKDAQDRANTAQAQAYNDAAITAQQKADAALASAQNYALAQSAYEREVAKAYADGLVTAEEQARIADAAAKLQAAKDDATAKVNSALAVANGYTDTKALATISAAQTYADNSAQTKANAAQANAISAASNDAQLKADAAQLAATTLSQQLIAGLKIGGRNLLVNTNNFKSLQNWNIAAGNTIVDNVTLYNGLPTLKMYSGAHLYQNVRLQPDTEYTISVLAKGVNTVLGFDSVPLHLQVWTVEDGANQHQEISVNRFDTTVTDKWKVVYRGFKTPSSADLVYCRVYFYYFQQDVNIAYFKLEEGNKVTDWSPAPEEVQTAIDNARISADYAITAYNNLTASLKSLAYADVVELSKLGTTVIENGMIKTTLLDANYIRANVVNAGYINTLQLDASVIKSGTIDSARINAAQIVVAGGGATVGQAQSLANAAQTAAALDAANKINALQIGGRNFYNYTNLITYENGAYLHLRELNNLWIIGVGSNDGKARIQGVLKGNGWHTVSFDARVGVVAWGNNRIQFADNPTMAFNLSTAFQHFEFSYNVQNYTPDVYNFIQFEGLSGQSYIFTNLKVEAGNKATTYTPAPEDVAKDAQDRANTAQSQAYNDAVVAAQQKADYALASAQNYADNSAQSKANVAQSNAISIASSDAQAKANAAQSAAATLSQQLVDGLKVGGKNLLFNSRNFKSLSNWAVNVPTVIVDNAVLYNGMPTIKMYNGSHFSQFARLKPNTEYTISVLVKGGSALAGGEDTPLHMQCYTDEDSGNIHQEISVNRYETTVTDKWKVIYRGFKTPNSANLVYYYSYYYNFGQDVNIAYFKLEEGNKITDWTPAPEEVQAAIDTAKGSADYAIVAYNNLTANLKSLAYADVVELSKLGSTVIENGMIKTTLLDANYIRANIVNASYITALDIVATKVAATQGFIGGFNIVNQSLIAGSGSDNPTAWDLNSSNIRLYTDFQLYRKIGGTADQTDEMAVHLGYYPATSGLQYKDTLVLKNNIRNTAQDYLPPSSLNGSGAVYRQKNRALILEAKNSDENIALEVMSGHVYLRGVNDAGTANALRNGYIKYVNMNGRQVLVLDSNPTELNTGIPDAQGLFWNDAQTGYATRSGCNGYDPQYGYEVGSEHQYTVPAHTYSSSVSKALANSQAASEAQNQAQYEADNFGYCYYQ